MFTGSYQPEDVIFLLKPIKVHEISIEEKEQLIQTGKSHYSQILSRETIPDEEWHRCFYDSIKRNGPRMAKELILLCRRIIEQNPKGPLVLVSLARAGTPVGALLCRALARLFHREVIHYSISIIRDRGLDENAIQYILKQHSQNEIFFIDGWGAKGSIANELHRDILNFNKTHQTNISSELYVLSDLCGKTDCSVSCDDYLIPGAMMNSTISGLISRTILNEQCNGPNDFHGCTFFSQFVPHDLSNWFLDEIYTLLEQLFNNKQELEALLSMDLISEKKIPENKINLYAERESFLDSIFHEYNVAGMNEIKPGICESTRAMLRRNWHLLLIKDRNLPDLQHLIHLAEIKKVVVVEREKMPFLAVSIAGKRAPS